MSKQWKPNKPTVELRPSRIRRDPPAPARVEKVATRYATQREIWTVVIGVTVFALTITVVTLRFFDIISF